MKDLPPDGSIDAGLLLLSLMPRETVALFSDGDIAFICGCHRSLFWLYEKRIKAKLRPIYKARGITRPEDAMHGREIVDLS